MGNRGNFARFAPLARASCVAAGCLVLAQCAGGISSRVDPRYGVSASPRVVQPGEPVPKGGGVYRVGKPYVVGGRTYVPEDNHHYRAEGLASWYGDDFHGRLTANGEVFDMGSISAAHPTLPMPSYVRVTNLRNGRSIIVRINDRGPYAANRLIDVSQHTAKLLGFYDHGLTRVRVEYAGPAPMQGSDDRMLMATLRENGQPAPANIMVASAQSAPPRQSHTPSPVPPERPYTLGDDNEPDVAPVARSAPRPQSRDVMTAQARIDRTMGAARPPSFASIEGTSAAPSAGVLAAPSVSAFASPGGGAAFASGRGLY